MSQSLKSIRYESKTIPWKKIQVKVFKLQKRIYRASLSGDVKKVHRWQKLLTKSWSAKCLAVRRVTQENRGRKTAGVDGIKSLNPKQRMELVNTHRNQSQRTTNPQGMDSKTWKSRKTTSGNPSHGR
ncbi:reverse transcriptase N-terminal domain-containing protein [Microseira wollei]|uniref:Reverse transcriptase n=1 Tax=Microseira wollei NIES-4236 TaxID=2530354 RepID=A0AAV3XBD9_9CYAN|nr:reverse transcriptase N-terminal domain-containing protein [Microseira wollei]GET39589.1 putative reverse transcriptase [Microseira wollei NIES-4236]